MKKRMHTKAYQKKRAQQKQRWEEERQQLLEQIQGWKEAAERAQQELAAIT